MEGILVALIGLAGSGLGSILGVLTSAKLTNYRLEQLEKRVQAHNSLVERREFREGIIKAANSLYGMLISAC